MPESTIVTNNKLGITINHIWFVAIYDCYNPDSFLDVREKLLIQGDIFLNTSLTEAFCMAVIEAVSCGTLVVSTKVGGIPEVLPPPFIHFVEPDVKSIENGLVDAIYTVIQQKQPHKEDAHQFIRDTYNWRDVARRTETVYDKIPLDYGGTYKTDKTIEHKLRNLWECGRLAGPMMATFFLFCHYWILLLDRLGW